MPVTAPTPPRLVGNCTASTMLLAWLLIQKFAGPLRTLSVVRYFTVIVSALLGPLPGRAIAASQTRPSRLRPDDASIGG
jgi:hypothetical protein